MVKSNRARLSGRDYMSRVGAEALISSRLVKAGLTWKKDLKERRELVHYMDIWTKSTLHRGTASTMFLELNCAWYSQETVKRWFDQREVSSRRGEKGGVLSGSSIL